MAGPVSSGDIVENYPYLWRRQALKGETEGRKFRPVCLALAVIDAKKLTHLALLPISGQPPAAGQRALELPPLEMRRISASFMRRDLQEFRATLLKPDAHVDRR